MSNQRTIHIAASICAIDSVLERRAEAVTVNDDNFEELALDHAWRIYNDLYGDTNWVHVKIWDENMVLLWQCSVEFETTAIVRDQQEFAPCQS